MLAQMMEKLSQVIQPNKPAATVANISVDLPAQSTGAEGTGHKDVLRAIQDLQLQVNNIASRRGRSYGRNASGADEEGVCGFHRKHGRAAFKCKTPCKRYNPVEFTITLGDGYYSKPPELIQVQNRDPQQQYANARNYYQAPPQQQFAQPTNTYQAPAQQPYGQQTGAYAASVPQQPAQAPQQPVNMMDVLTQLTTVISDLSKAHSGNNNTPNF